MHSSHLVHSEDSDPQLPAPTVLGLLYRSLVAVVGYSAIENPLRLYSYNGMGSQLKEGGGYTEPPSAFQKSVTKSITVVETIMLRFSILRNILRWFRSVPRNSMHPKNIHSRLENHIAIVS